MQNSNQVLGNKFDKLYFCAKSQVKRGKNQKIKCSTSLKRSGHVDTSLKSYDHAEFKSGAWKQI